MKILKILVLLVLLATTVALDTVSVYSAAPTNYSGGLLDHKSFNYGDSNTTSNGTTVAITDNSESTSYTTNSANMYLWVTIPSSTVGSYKFNGGNGELELYDASGVKIYSENPPAQKDGTIRYLPSVISGVVKIVFRGYPNTVSEFNIYVEQKPTPVPVLLPLVRGQNIKSARVVIVNYDQAKSVDQTLVLPYAYSNAVSKLGRST